MNYYETLYIIHPALESGRLKDIIMEVEDSLKKMGGDPLAIELWGKRKLAYFIDKQKYGTYVLVQYNGKGKCTSDFAIELEHNPNILAYLTTNINQNDIIEQEENLETQIAGKTRESERVEARSEKDSDKGQKGNSIETINKEESFSGKDKQAVSPKENIKDDENKTADLPDEENDDKQMDVSEVSETINENKLTVENPKEATALESNQEKANEPAAINEKE